MYSIYRTYDNKDVIFINLNNKNQKKYNKIILNDNNNIYLIYSFDNIKIKNKNVIYLKYNLVDLFDVINISNHFIFKNRPNNYINEKLLNDIYDELTIDTKFKFDNNYIKLNNELYNFINKNIELTSNSLKCYCLLKNIKINKIKKFETNFVEDWNNIKHSNIKKNFNKLKEYIVNIINKIDINANYKNFLEYNCFFSKNININVEYNYLENIYYTNKQFFDINGNLIVPTFIRNDMEYKRHSYKHRKHIKTNKLEHLDKNTMDKAIKINDKNVLFLDYIYTHYNFGEFWDCIFRVMSNKNISNLKLFHLKKNKIKEIKYYFKLLNIEYPSNDDLLINYDNNSNKVIFFKKLNFVNILNKCRGYFDYHIAYKFNNIFNKSNHTNKGLILYLKRHRRNLLNEDYLIDKLNIYENLKIINGDESLDKIIFYFTNAKLIIGTHGSLFKNMIFCKKNPLLIELCPKSRANGDFHGNAKFCNFLHIFIILNNFKNENIYLSNEQIDKLITLTKYFI